MLCLWPEAVRVVEAYQIAYKDIGRAPKDTNIYICILSYIHDKIYICIGSISSYTKIEEGVLEHYFG